MERREEDYPTDEQLIATYNEIESKAVKAINGGRVGGNPLLKQSNLERRYSLCAQGLIYGSEAHQFLTEAINQLAGQEPNIKYQPPKFLHFTLGEVVFVEPYTQQKQKPRVLAGVDADVARTYHQALREELSHYQNPIELNLYQVFPSLDRAIGDRQSISVVAAFLTGDEPNVFRLRSDINASVKISGLNLSSRLGPIKVLFVTLGRFIDSPDYFGDKVPFLKVLDNINEAIPEKCPAQIDSVQLISTATSYIGSEGHVFVDPPIRLNNLYRSRQPVRFLRPSTFSLKLDSRC